MLAARSSRFPHSCQAKPAPQHTQAVGLVQPAACPTAVAASAFAASAALGAGSRAQQAGHLVQAVATGHLPPASTPQGIENQQDYQQQPSMLAATSMSDHIQVGQHNFWSALPTIRQTIQAATFVALDFEMTGLWADGMGPGRLDGYAARYAAIKQSASQFLPVQMGVSCFEWTGQAWKAQTFNISLYPAGAPYYSPTFSVSTDALQFLASQGFDLSAWVNTGAKFMPLTKRNAQLAAYDASIPGASGSSNPSQASKRAATATTSLQVGLEALKDVNDVAAAAAAAAASTSADADADLSKQFQQAWHGQSWQQLSTKIMSWLDQGQQAESSLELPVTSPAAASFLQALIRLELWCRPDLPAFTTTILQPTSSKDGPVQPTASSSTTGQCLVRLERSATRRPGDALPTRGQAVRRASIHKATGPAVILDIIRAAAVPVVLHHGILDLALLMHHLRGGPLPATWAAYKTQLCKWFPGGIYDSKYLAILRAVHTASSTTPAPGHELTAQQLHRVPLLSWFAQLCNGSIAPPTDARGPDRLSIQPANTQGTIAASSAPIYHAAGFHAYQDAARHAIAHAAALAVQSELQSGDEEDTPNTPTASNTASSLDGSLSPLEDQDTLPVEPPVRLLAHEAGFDAFMTGAVFTRLLAGPYPGAHGPVHPAAGQTAAGTAGQDAAHADMFSDVRPFAWRLNGTRGVPYYSLQGPDAVPDVSDVFLLKGLNPQMAWWEVAKRWQAAGIGPVHVFMLDAHPGMWAGELASSSAPTTTSSTSNRPGSRQRGKNTSVGAGQSSSTGTALVRVTKPEQVPLVMQATTRMDKAWTVLPLQEVYAQKQ